ncbi:MAG TPA: ABC transporter substrate-binding protein [Sporichthya sp.]|nr:ABC transporter substrate-binding protein [Sporichthya sp.]
MTVRPAATRRIVAALFTAAAMLATSACGSDSNAGAPDAQPSSGATVIPVADSGLPPVERGAYPVRIAHTWDPAGTVIQSEPQRVVVLGMREQDTMTALGMRPLTIRNFFGAAAPWTSFPWLTDFQRTGNYTVINTPTRDSKTGKLSGVNDGPILANGFAQASNTPERKEVFDYDAIKAMNPDLIVAMFAGLVLEDYQKLKEIAPTITMVSSDSKDYFSSWQEEMLVLGKITGRPNYSIQLVAKTQQLFIDALAAHPELKEASIALAAPGPNGQIRILNPYAEMSRFFTALGMQFPGRIEAATRYTGVSRKMYGIETTTGNLNFLDGVDALVWIVGHDGRDAMDKIKATSAYRDMRAVKENRVVELGPDEAEAIFYSSATSLPWALNKIVPQLVSVLGDKAARDRNAEEQAQKAADAAGDLAINYEPTKTADPNLNPGASTGPSADPSRDLSTEPPAGDPLPNPTSTP